MQDDQEERVAPDPNFNFGSSVVDDEDGWRTRNLPLAAYLSLKGLRVTERKLDKGECWWFFADSPTMRQLCQDYLDGTARVMPSQYHRRVGRMKREAFDLIDGRA